ncbi:MAG: hypothetical protein PHO26_03255 [Dehalococcoidia bacterium]|nr:hypothetical protein [Dehalococcoidia bacterium]MDD5495354.1 hypothetical protein [Dehalococcoidia bacterium]
MISLIAVYAGAGIIILWGIAHLFPTAAIVKGFGEISADNKKILIMEWVGAGLWMCFVGVLCLLITAMGMARDSAATVVYAASSTMLMISAVLGFATGFQTNSLPIKMCPFVQMLCSMLLLSGVNIV